MDSYKGYFKVQLVGGPLDGALYPEMTDNVWINAEGEMKCVALLGCPSYKLSGEGQDKRYIYQGREKAVAV